MPTRHVLQGGAFLPHANYDITGDWHFLRAPTLPAAALAPSGVAAGSGLMSAGVGVAPVWLSAPALDVRLYGATGDGTTDDTAAIQASLTVVGVAGGGTVVVPQGTHQITAPLTVASRVHLVGVGAASVLRASQIAGWSGTAARAMIEVNGADDASVRDLVLDMAGTGRMAAKAIGYGLMITNARRTRIEGVTFRDMGYGTAPADAPSGPCLLLAARDSALDLTPYPTIQTGPCTDTIVRRCVFEGTSTFEFGIRLLTDFVLARDPAAYTHTLTGTVIEHCTFSGSFPWNSVELAGGGTRHNRITRCTFTGQTLSHVDFDKACSHNVAAENRILSGGKPDKYLADATKRLAVFDDHGIDTAYQSEGNQIVHNTIQNIVSTVGSVTASFDCAIAVNYSRRSLVQGNTITNVEGGLTGCGILLATDTPGARILDNTIKGVLIGIRTDTSISDRERVQVCGNQVESAAQGIAFSGTTPGAGPRPAGLTIAYNTVRSLGSTLQCILVSTEINGVTLVGNTALGGQDGFWINAVDAVLVGNTARDNSSTAYRVLQDATLIGNLSYGATADLTLTAGKQLRAWGNTFRAAGAGAGMGPVVMYGAAAPVAGAWKIGDRLWDVAPTAGGTEGWVCTTAGTPGTWKAFGSIAA